MHRVRTLLTDCELDPMLLVIYWRESREAIAYRDPYAFRDATRRFCVGKFDESAALLWGLGIYGGFYIGSWQGALVAIVVTAAFKRWFKNSLL